jgi:ribosomal protein S12 methylthiotransferase
MADYKKNGRCRRLVVTGCLAERYKAELRREIPEIDAVLGTGEVPDIVRAITDASHCAPAHNHRAAPGRISRVQLYRRNGDAGADPFSSVPRRTPAARHRGAAAVRNLPTYIYDAETPRTLTTPRHYAYVKIAEGCDYNCSFCIIPALRGQYRSRSVASILQEARRLAALGVRELLLVSQDTTFYGVDRHERGALADLLRQLDGVDGIAWVRLLYLYPTTITSEVLQAMADSKRVCRYIDVPLQHTSAPLLERMRRPGNRAAYERLVERIRTRIPGVAVRTTFIVGFPGETEDDFADLYDFVGAVGFDHVGVFTYSHEEDTAAYDLVDDVPAAEKEHRRRHLMALQKRIVNRRHRAMKGARVQVLVDGPSPEHELVLRGRIEGQAPEIDPVVYLSECDSLGVAPGTLVDAEVIGSRGYDLIARPLAAPRALC